MGGPERLALGMDLFNQDIPVAIAVELGEPVEGVADRQVRRCLQGGPKVLHQFTVLFCPGSSVRGARDELSGELLEDHRCHECLGLCERVSEVGSYAGPQRDSQGGQNLLGGCDHALKRTSNNPVSPLSISRRVGVKVLLEVRFADGGWIAQPNSQA